VLGSYEINGKTEKFLGHSRNYFAMAPDSAERLKRASNNGFVRFTGECVLSEDVGERGHILSAAAAFCIVTRGTISAGGIEVPFRPWPQAINASAAAAEAARARNPVVAAAAAERARQAAAAAAKAEEERARLAAILSDAEAGPCLRMNTDKANCVTVIFGRKTKYDRKGTPGTCVFWSGSATWTDLGNFTYRFIGPAGTVVQFFDIPMGQTYNGSLCK